MIGYIKNKIFPINDSTVEKIWFSVLFIYVFSLVAFSYIVLKYDLCEVPVDLPAEYWEQPIFKKISGVLWKLEDDGRDIVSVRKFNRAWPKFCIEETVFKTHFEYKTVVKPFDDGTTEGISGYIDTVDDWIY